MNTFENWLVKWTIAKEVIQGYDHARKIEALYALIRKVCEEEFTEDNAPTMDAFLRERFEATQYTPNGERCGNCARWGDHPTHDRTMLDWDRAECLIRNCCTNSHDYCDCWLKSPTGRNYQTRGKRPNVKVSGLPQPDGD